MPRTPNSAQRSEDSLCLSAVLKEELQLLVVLGVEISTGEEEVLVELHLGGHVEMPFLRDGNSVGLTFPS